MSKKASIGLLDEISNSLNRGVDELSRFLTEYFNNKLPILLERLFGRLTNREVPIERAMLKKKKASVMPDELGYSINERRLIKFDEVNFSRHTFISGASGWGKSFLFKILIENTLRNERPLVYIDPKGANSEIQTFINLCEKYGRKYYIFSEHFHSPSQFNPLADLDSEQVVEGVIRSFNWGLNPEQYYLNKAQEILSDVVFDLKAKGRIVDFHTILEGVLAHKNKDEASGLIANLKTICRSNFGKLLKDSFSENSSNPTAKTAMTMRKALDEGACIYIGASTQGYGSMARTIGKIFVNELLQLSHYRGVISQSSTENIGSPFAVFIDEAGSILFQDFIDLINKARSSGIQIYTAVQSMQDFDALAGGKPFMKQLFECYSNFIFLRQSGPESAEMVSSLFGTYLSKKETEVIEDGGKTGKGSTREVNEFRVHPDIVKELNIGQALFLSLGPRKFHLLNLRNPEKTTYPKEFTQSKPEIKKIAPIKKSEKRISFKG
jgi:type IV secretory pathway TraG/TraD family ATPase VirD4